MNDDELKMFAANIILDHVQDVEFLSIGEFLQEQGIDYSEADQRKIYDLIYGDAEIRVYFE